MKVGDKEFYELMAQFERDMPKKCYGVNFDREDRKSYLRGHYYCNGSVNSMFIGYMHGYSLGRAVGRIESE